MHNDRPNPDIPEDYWEPLWPGKPIKNEYKHVGGPDFADTWCNDKCQVFVYDYPEVEGWPPIIEMSLKLNSREPWRDWRDFYRIKSELCGTMCWAIEVYPSQDALVDSANQYHMFVFPPGMQFPIRLAQAAITDYSPAWDTMHKQGAEEFGAEAWAEMTSRSKQREWHEHHKCDDLPAIGPVWRKRGYFLNEDGGVEKGDPPPPEKPVAMQLMEAVMKSMQDTPFGDIPNNENEPAKPVRPKSKTSKSKKNMSKRSRQKNRKRRKR